MLGHHRLPTAPKNFDRIARYGARITLLDSIQYLPLCYFYAGDEQGTKNET